MAQRNGVNLTLSIGIDFGNRNSSIAVHNFPSRGKVTVLQNGITSTYRFPTYVARAADSPDEYLAGTIALVEANGAPASEQGACDLKRHLGRGVAGHEPATNLEMTGRVAFNARGRATFRMRATSSQAEHDTVTRLVAEMFRHLVNEAENYLNNHSPIREVTITIPCHFGPDERDALREAAKAAGLRVAGLIEDPVAAILGFTKVPPLEAINVDTAIKGRRFAVVDMGDRCLTASILTCTADGDIAIEATHCDTDLGGSHFDECLRSFLLQALQDPKNRPVAAYHGTATEKELLLLREATRIKECFANSPTKNVLATLPVAGLIITPDQFDQMCSDVYLRIPPLLHQLKESPGHNRPLDFVLAVGGGMRLPRVRALVQEVLIRPIFIPSQADVMGARGAALFAHLLRETAAENVPEYTVHARPVATARHRQTPGKAPAGKAGGIPLAKFAHEQLFPKSVETRRESFTPVPKIMLNPGMSMVIQPEDPVKPPEPNPPIEPQPPATSLCVVFGCWIASLLSGKIEAVPVDEVEEKPARANSEDETFCDNDPTSFGGPRSYAGLAFWTVTVVGTILCVPSSMVRGFVGLAGACGFRKNCAAEAKMEHGVLPARRESMESQQSVELEGRPVAPPAHAGMRFDQGIFAGRMMQNRSDTRA